jgi:hypothetical protein
MSTSPHQSASTTGEPLANLLFDYPGADIILCSQDRCHFRVPKTSIVSNSPVLGELIQKKIDPPGDANAEASLPVVQLPESGTLLHCLLTFIFPITPLVLSTIEETMELLSVAQKYQMGTALTHIRGTIARQNSLPTSLEPALRIYSLAQKYGLRPEALQTARVILLKHSMTIEDFDDKLDIMTGASLYELIEYDDRVRDILGPDLTEFMESCARGTITGLRCDDYSSHGIPTWLDDYIKSIGEHPDFFDLVEFNAAMACHLVLGDVDRKLCECGSIPTQTIRKFWEALSSVVLGSFEKVSVMDLPELHRMLKLFLQAESAFCLVREREDSQAKVSSTIFLPKPFGVPDANFIIRSSDNVNFRAHKSVLAMVSPFFSDLLSLPQPPDSDSESGDLPMVQVFEDSELLNCLLSMLYPVRPVIPNSYDKVYHLLAACQKYDMTSVQSFIRAEVNRGEFPAPKGTEAFSAYAIASGRGLIPEMENAAHLTLDNPMTLETLAEGLRLFEGWALRDLIEFRRRCIDNLDKCLHSFLEVQPPGPSIIWVGCPEVMPSTPFQETEQPNCLPKWLKGLLLWYKNELEGQLFTHPLDIHSRIRQEYVAALQGHATCNFCLKVHLNHGLTFCTELENKLAQACNKVI